MVVQFGHTSYRLLTREQSGSFVAYACRGESPERFGVETTAASADEAMAKLTRWLEWQHQHTEALDQLQEAERAYHRTIAGAAFTDDQVGPDAAKKQALDAVTAARNLLDDVRARRPNV
jgi:hypothetical protein